MLGEIHQILLIDFSMQMSPKTVKYGGKNLGFGVGLDTVTTLAINDVISGFAKVVVERCGFHHWIAQRISWGEVVSVFLYLL